MSRRVVITGMGAITPIGLTVEEFWNSVKESKLGFDKITRFDTTDYKATIAAEVKGFDARNYMDFKAAKRMELFSQYAVAAAKEAIEDASLDMEKEDPYRVGTCVGSGIGSLQIIEKEHVKLLEKGPNKVAPLFVPLLITNMASGNVSMQFGLKGKSINVVTACATGTNSIGEAYRSIQYGEADVMVSGGSEASITPLGVAAFTALTALSPSDDPKRASIPFDKERSGFVMGEGAAVLVLEELEHAKKRGAKIYAEITGYGASSDAYHVTSPDPEGVSPAMAMKNAMRDAGIAPADVDYVNAHGTSTHLNDLYESHAISIAMGEEGKGALVSSTKSMIGHLLGAAGAIELITCVKSIQEGYVHPNVGYKVDDEELIWGLNYVKGEGIHKDINICMSNSLGFGGHNASLIVRKYTED